MRRFIIGVVLGVLLSASVAVGYGEFTEAQRREIKQIARQVVSECALLADHVSDLVVC